MSPLPVRILNLVNEARALSTYLFNINFNILLVSRARSSKWSLFVLQPCHHLIIHDVVTRDAICCGTEINICSQATKILGYLFRNRLFVLLK
jgi:hypothetical protein